MPNSGKEYKQNRVKTPSFSATDFVQCSRVRQDVLYMPRLRLCNLYSVAKFLVHDWADIADSGIGGLSYRPFQSQYFKRLWSPGIYSKE
jgi:hypothetical protein